MTCQPHSYFITTIRGYLAAYGWENCQNNDAIATKAFIRDGAPVVACICLTFGRGEADHRLSARFMRDGYNVLAACTLELAKAEPVFQATIKSFAQDIELAIAAA